MGASPSTPQSPHQHEQESLAASTTPLPTLRAAFSAVSHTPTALLETFTLPSVPDAPPRLAKLLSHLGPAIAAHFISVSTTPMTWDRFLSAYNRFCARVPASQSLTAFIRVYSETCILAGVPTGLEVDDGGEVGGMLSAEDLRTVLLVCWMMGRAVSGGVLVLPEVDHLVVSAVVGDEDKVLSCDFESLGSVDANKLVVWMAGTIPGVAGCLPQFVQERLRACAASKDPINSNLSAVESPSCIPVHDNQLLTCGRAWAISLTLRSTLREELRGSCFPGSSGGSEDNLLYRSSIHGKGLSRFWSSVEGYHGPMLILISANSEVSPEGEGSTGKWVIGVLTEQGFENRVTFYGNSGCLYAISPVFRVFPHSGRDKNFVYCHLHPSVKAYDPHPKPVGLAFGGTIGNERIHIDEDFDRVIIRHHAYDKTYQHGSLIPNQGFLPVEALLMDAEVWGLGGKAAQEKQNSYKKREELFSDQRRKVDLKTFGNWEDSPEKAMMDMVSDPNRARREDR